MLGRFLLTFFALFLTGCGDKNVLQPGESGSPEPDATAIGERVSGLEFTEQANRESEQQSFFVENTESQQEPTPATKASESIPRNTAQTALECNLSLAQRQTEIAVDQANNVLSGQRSDPVRGTLSATAAFSEFTLSADLGDVETRRSFFGPNFQQFEVTFSQPGLVRLTAVISNSRGQTATCFNTLTVIGPPVPTLSILRLFNPFNGNQTYAVSEAHAPSRFKRVRSDFSLFLSSTPVCDLQLHATEHQGMHGVVVTQNQAEVNEGAHVSRSRLGFCCPVQYPGTVPLQRLFLPTNGSFLALVDPDSIDQHERQGWVREGPLCFVPNI